MLDKLSDLLNVNSLWAPCQYVRDEIRCEWDPSCYSEKGLVVYNIDTRSGEVCAANRTNKCNCWTDA
ncbi:hypothetical protein BW898_26355 [Bacillus cereus]|nr:hypothetical protein BW898_26355 [Bacillus cereus]